VTDLATYRVARGRVPLAGHTPSMVRDPFRFLRSLQGQADIVRVDFGTIPTYFLTEPKLINTLLTDHDGALDKGRFYDKVRPLAGNGVVLANGDEHRRQLAMVKPSVHRTQVNRYAEVMREVATDKATSWRAGQRIAADKEMHAITLRILASTMFGAGVDAHAVSELVRLLPAVLKGIMWRTVVPDAVNRVPLPVNRRFDRAFAELREAINRIMRSYRERGVDNGDLMSVLLATRDEKSGEPLTEREVCDQIVAVTMAGAETAATALAWTFYEMARHPEIERKVADEVRDVIGDRDFEIGDVAELEYVKRVLQESLRLRQPILVISRRTTRPMDLGGRKVPAGTELFYSPYGVFRDPSLYPSPERFDPDRWLARPVTSLPRGAFVPFGGGPRHCFGEHFAWTMMAAVVVEVTRRWRLDLPPGFRAREMPWATVNPSSLPMTVLPRAGR